MPTLRERGKRILRQMPTVRELARRPERHLKGMVLPGTLFEELGFNYIGPVDGHDVPGARKDAPERAASSMGPSSSHVVTRKGKGYAPAAEADPIKWHGPGAVRSGQRHPLFKEKEHRPDLFAGLRYSGSVTWLRPIRKIVGVTPAMREGSGLVEFSKRFPERYFDVAIAEQHAR